MRYLGSPHVLLLALLVGSVEGQSCSNGPKSGTDGFAIYGVCSSKQSGELCIPGCAAGYSLQGSFVLICDTNEQYDASGATCSPNTCTNGPNAGADASADYTACNTLVTGNSCTPTCPSGTASSGSFSLVCQSGFYDATGATCTPNSCSGGPTVPNAAIDYSSCLVQQTGDICSPSCLSGSTGSGGFSLVCNSNQFVSTFTCSPNSCAAGPLTTANNANYDSCNLLTSGQTCVPTCSSGYTLEGSFTLQCDGGKYPTTGAICRANTCTAGPTNPSVNTDYSGCNLLSTGQVCVPSCTSGSVQSGSFILQCSGTGVYSASGASCSASACGGGPNAGSDSLADYSSCNVGNSGDTCIPSCPTGYTVMGSFTLVCVGGNYDASGATCSPNSCTGGPTAGTSDPRATYTSCSGFTSGVNCVVSCQAGYVASGSLALSCNNLQQYNAASVTCLPGSCSSGPITSQANTDYSLCNAATTGQSCSPICDTGYTLSGPLLLSCVNSVYDASSVSCNPNACSSGPSAGTDIRAVYTACNALSTGSVCTPACTSGYNPSGSFVLTCDAGRNYDASGVTCQAASCTNGPVTGTAQTAAIYTNCNAKITGETCIPSCGAGYTVAGSFTLSCDVNSEYNAAGATCTAGTCSGGPSSHIDGSMDYTNCNSLTTGQVCIPVCNSGYTLQGQISLVCVGGRYSATGASCSANSCSGGPTVPDTRSIYTACNALSSGQTCTPTCQTGYSLMGGSFILTCISGNYDASSASCFPDQCMGGPITNSDPNADYTTCNLLRTGQTCFPGCNTGYVLNGRILLSCTNQQYDASGATCDPIACTTPTVATQDAQAIYTSCAGKQTGEQCTITCNAGYAPLTGTIDLVCTPEFDASGAVCSNCANGPSAGADPLGDYSLCNRMISGSGNCAPTCPAGYQVMGSFAMTCTGLQYDATGATCQANSCTGASVNVDPNMNYASCNIKTSGQVCEPDCATGYTRTGSFNLVCDVAGVYDATGATCVPNTCLNGQYTSCNSLVTGQGCLPECQVGYHAISTFALVCVGNTYSTAAASCLASSCVAGPTPGTSDANAVYTSCSSRTTGQQCTPVCSAGYQLSGSFTLVCSDVTKMFDASSSTCQPLPCTNGPSGNTDPNGIYTSCNSLFTGQDCVPACNPGYTAVGSFSLLCVGGRYDATGATCQSDSCNNGPTNPNPNGDYSSCNIKVSGDLCTPVCSEGYTSSGGFTLSCISGSYNIGTHTCVPNSCSNGVRPPIPAATDFTPCNSLTTGQVCTPTCTVGYQLNIPFSINCDSSQTYNSSTSLCQPLPCTGGPFMNAALFANYDDCSSKFTGETCTPTCSAGYNQIGSFPLVCTAGTYDAAGAICDPGVCSGGPTNNTDGFAYYNDCNSLKTGDFCTPSCQVGYSNVGTISMVCEGTFYDAAGSSCQLNSCFNGPTVPLPVGDVSHCSGLITNQVCDITCPPGYIGTSISVICLSNSTFSPEGLTCTPSTCTGGPTSTDINVLSYQQCNTRSTGDTCRLQCNPDYTVIGTIELLCDAVTKQYDPSGSQCVPNTNLLCNLGVDPITENPNATYTDCTSSYMGQTCSPQCNDGYTKTSGGSMTLYCINGKYNDTTGTVCTPNTCSSGPLLVGSELSFQKAYSSCNLLSTGMTCQPICGDGYDSAAVASFVVECMNNGSYIPSDASKCQPNSCFNGPSWSLPSGDITHCSALVTGQTCDIRCPPGYVGTSINVVCHSNSTFTPAGLLCERSTCEGGPLVVDGNTLSYDQCNTGRTGDYCRLQCKSGFTVVGTVELSCDATTKKYDASGSQCVSNSDLHCRNGPTQSTSSENSTYDECISRNTGDTCTPQCKPGFTRTSGGSMNLFCVNGFFNDTSGITCVPNSCFAGPLVSNDLQQSYSQCDTLKTGDTCTPICSTGYSSAAVVPFPLVCYSNGTYVPHPSTCEPNLCSAGPTGVVDSNTLYSDCSTNRSGDSCNVRCVDGYVPPSTGFVLACNDVGQFNVPVGSSCSPQTCFGGPTLNANGNMDYSSCLTMKTSESCTPTCASGTGQPAGSITLVCDAVTGTFDASGASCVLICDGMGTICPPPGQCQISTCSGSTCSTVNKPEGTVCNDNINSTINDVCVSGLCTGQDLCSNVVCPAATQCQIANICDSATGLCSATSAADGSVCDDGNLMTKNDVCMNGECKGTSLCDNVVCASVSSCHGVGTCDPLTGLCSQPLLANGTTCNDNNPLTSEDQCYKGTCVGITVCGSGACPLPEPCHSYNCINSLCVHTQHPNRNICNDNNPETRNDMCTNGVCKGEFVCNKMTLSNQCRVQHSLIDISNVNQQCIKASVCDYKTGIWSTENQPNGLPCDDHNDETIGDSCQQGVCIGVLKCTSPCLPINNCHVTGQCDPGTGLCLNPRLPDFSSCDDGDAGTFSDVCIGGVCSGAITCGSLTDCRAIDECHYPQCDQNRCVQLQKPNLTPCLSGSCRSGVCTRNEVCNAESCVPPSQCHIAACNTDGVCAVDMKINTSPCDDGDPLTINDACFSGVCCGESLCENTKCPPVSSCHDWGVCDPATGECSYPIKPDGVACDDGQSGSINDVCKEGVCVGEAGSPCNNVQTCSFSSCEVPICNGTSTSCVTVWTADGSFCSSDSSDSLPDTCISGECVKTDLCADKICVPIDQCHTPGTCNPNSGVCTTPKVADGTPCDDGNPLTNRDVCTGGFCLGSLKCAGVQCPTRNDCNNAGECDPFTGLCAYTAYEDGTACSDGNSLTVRDSCKGGYCTGELQCGNSICIPGTCHTAVCVGNSCTQVPVQNGQPCNDNDPLTDDDSCQSGVCVGASTCNAVQCLPVSVANNSCYDQGECDPSTGSCQLKVKPDNSECDDGNPDTVTDRCKSGTCFGINRCHNITCSPLSSCHYAGVCNPSTGLCSNPKRQQGTSCDDNNPLTTNDRCVDGKCSGQVFCSGSCTSNSKCRSPVCVQGSCSEIISDNNTPCDDDNDLTQNDKCIDGICKGDLLCKPDTVCTPLSQCHRPGICNHASGLCSNPVTWNGKPCDDSDGTTENDICWNGVCSGTKRCISVQCRASDECHLPGTCNDFTGLCTDIAKPDHTPCDDNNPLTSGDVCRSGNCRGTLTCGGVTCQDPVSDCSYVACNGTCVELSKPDNTICNDANPMTINDRCMSGSCRGDDRCSNTTCGAIDQCLTKGDCNPSTGKCEYSLQPDGTKCDDKSDLTTDDKCVNGVCKGDPLCAKVTCAAADSCHSVGECISGICTDPPLPDGTGCDDSNPQTTNDICLNGICSGTLQCGSIQCKVLDSQCQQSTCSSQSTCGQVPVLDGTPCSDGLSYTINDKCQNGVCVGQSKCDGVTCNAISQCHEKGTCQETTGICTTPVKDDGELCDDGDASTTLDTCQVGICIGSVISCQSFSGCASIPQLLLDPSKQCPATGCTIEACCIDQTLCDDVVCVASDSCHLPGSCDPFTGLCSDPYQSDGVQCHAGLSQAVTSVCQSGVCTGSIQCGSNQCTAASQCQVPICVVGDQCGSENRPDGTPCNDNNATTSNDVCSNGLCIGVDKCEGVVCVASDQCHELGVCRSGTGLCSDHPKPFGTPCDDGIPETEDDKCISGVCVGTAPCSSGTCSTTRPQCWYPTCSGMQCTELQKPDNTPCNDGLETTSNDVCTNGVCAGSDLCANKHCPPLGQCYEPSTCFMGNCISTLVPDYTACDDGNRNTYNDTCSRGVCVGILKCVDSTCSSQLSQCELSKTCDVLTGLCEPLYATDGTLCDDGSSTTTNDRCLSGTCFGEISCGVGSCSTGSPCRRPSCLNGICFFVNAPDLTVCNDQNSATTSDVCRNGVCKGTDLCESVVCGTATFFTSPLRAQCYNSKCNPINGLCELLMKPDYTPCNDNSGLTRNDYCQKGVCTGEAICDQSTCELTTPEEQCLRKQCNWQTGSCEISQYPDGTACNDDNANTVFDACYSGVCKGRPVCSTSCPVIAGSYCSTPVCRNGLQCTYASDPDGTLCFKNNIKGKCDNGVCVTGIPSSCSGVVCYPQSQCHYKAFCSNGVCGSIPKPDFSLCDLSTNEPAHCIGGVCTAADLCNSFLACQQQTKPDSCQVSVQQCDPLTGGCLTETRPDGFLCNDGSPQTQADRCISGNCVGVTECGQTSCITTESCMLSRCVAGSCVVEDKPDGSTCDDQNEETINDICLRGVCTGQDSCSGIDCSTTVVGDGSCISTWCSKGVCRLMNNPNNTICDDSNPETTSDRCWNGICRGELKCGQKTCETNDQCHVTTGCNSTTGLCNEIRVADNTDCDDGNPSTTNDVCIGGQCIGSVICTVFCRSPSTCMTAVCNGNSCSYIPVTNGVTCTDEDPTTTGDACLSGVCIGTPICSNDCSIQLPETQCLQNGECDYQTGLCRQLPKSDNTLCDDANSNTVSDKCLNGICVGKDYCDLCSMRSSTSCISYECSDNRYQFTGMIDESLPKKCTPKPAPDSTSCSDNSTDTVNDVCINGVCQGQLQCNGVLCSKPQSQCHVMVCSSTNCLEVKQPDQTPCVLMSSESSNGKCLSGICISEPTCGPNTCQPVSQCHNPGVCVPLTGECTSPMKPNYTLCDDGDDLTFNDQCVSGICSGTSQCKDVTCTFVSISQCHTGVECNPMTGLCDLQNRDDGSPCNDNDPSTINDRCMSGICSGQVQCVNDLCELRGCQKPVCLSTGCDYSESLPDNTPCDDNDPNTANDQCISSVCQGTNLCSAVVCQAQSQCHYAGRCLSSTGMCSTPILPNGTPCDDSDSSTQLDSCQNGVCVGKDLCFSVTCTASDQCHEAGVCDPLTGLCSDTRKGEGTPCDDGNPQTDNDKCTQQGCVGNLLCGSTACTASNECSEVFCNNNVCSERYLPVGRVCNDNNPETLNDTCNGEGLCVGKATCSEITCIAESDCKAQGICIPSLGVCTTPNKPDGSQCNGGDGTCVSGSCIINDKCKGVICTPSDQCHLPGTCDPLTGLCSDPIKPDDLLCDDLDSSTVSKCVSGSCIPTLTCGTTVCTAPVCHDVSCSSGICVTSPRDGTTCNDNNVLTFNDTCVNGQCIGLQRCEGVTCITDNPCLFSGSCNPGTGVCDFPQKLDGTQCGTGLKCISGECVRNDVCGTGTVCLASSQCHEAGPCTPRGECSEVPKIDYTPCDDEDPLTVGDSCRSGVCVGVKKCAVPCLVSLNSCHDVGVCNNATGLCYYPPKPDGTACDDGNPATFSSFCSSGNCIGTTTCAQQNCTAGTACRIPVCQGGQQCSSSVAVDNTICDDGDNFTSSDTCKAGSCQGTNKCEGVVCTAIDSCHQVGTCDLLTGLCSAPLLPDDTPCSIDASCVKGVCKGFPIQTCATFVADCQLIENPLQKTCRTCDAATCCQTCSSYSKGCPSGSLLPQHASIVCKVGGCDEQTCCTPNKCQGVTCQPSDSCHTAGTCNELTGLCSNPIVPNSIQQPCDDNNQLTINDTCISGICTGELVCGGNICRPISQCYKVYCGVDINNNPTCIDKVSYDGTPCDDGNPLTDYDICTSGVCLGTDKCRGVICTPSSQCRITPGTCDPLTGLCSYLNLRDGTPCDDGNTATTNDACTLGVCRGYIICGGVPCRSSQCHDATCSIGGQCVITQKPADYICDDQDEGTIDDKCTSDGRCVGTPRCTSTSCSNTATDSCHEVAVCSFKTGLCIQPIKPDGTVCDTGKVCIAGACAAKTDTACGTVVCRPINPHCYTATCENNICTQKEKFDGTPCNDDDPETVDDRCISGRCTGVRLCASQTCPSDNPCYKNGYCDPMTGLCVFQKFLDEEASPCNDNNPNTENDICRNGACSGTLINCQTDTCRSDNQCQDISSTGVLINQPPNSPCNDNNHLTTNDVCNAGVCAGVEICRDVQCYALDQCHSPGDCRGGKCTNPILPDDTPCNDNNPLTTRDVCMAGQCVGIIANCQVALAAVDCIPTEPQCKVARCDQLQVSGILGPQTCYSVNKADGTPCDDADPSTVDDICRSGICSGNSQQQLCSQVTCTPSTTCKISTCVNGQCVQTNKAHNTNCNDGNPLTTNDRCMSGVCKGDLVCKVGNNDITCQATTKPCHTVTCNTGSGFTCLEQQLADGTLCDDGDSATVSDKCESGICVGVKNCDQTTCNTPPSSQSCMRHSGVCDFQTGSCQFNPSDVSVSCNDGNPLTTSDHCQGFTCTGSIPCGSTFCVPNNPQCSEMFCNPSNNTCTYKNIPNGSSCDDYNATTFFDTCQNGMCVGQDLCQDVTCSSSTPCSSQMCDYNTGLCVDRLFPDGTDCYINGTISGVCEQGVCNILSTCDNITMCLLSSNDDQQCSYPICDNGACSVMSVPDFVPCSDGDSSTENDLCMAGKCVGTVRCDASKCVSKPCMKASCSQQGVCTYSPLTDYTTCSDFNPSTVNDTCMSGVCVGASDCANDLVCSTQNPCLRPECGTSSLSRCSFVPKPDNVQCDDSDPLTINDRCKSGICQGTNLCTDVICTPSECEQTSICDYQTGQCRITKSVDGTSCSDGHCSNGLCSKVTTCGFIGGAQTVCNPPDRKVNQCKMFTCDINQSCVEMNVADHTKCDDNNDATVADECLLGSCVGVSNCQGVICTSRSGCQFDGICNPKTGTCEYKLQSDGTSCNDGDTSTSNELCLAGQCISPTNCGGDICIPESACSSASCIDNVCVRTQLPEGSPCDDNSDQTHNDICRSNGLCEGTNYCNPDPCYLENESAKSSPTSCLLSSTCRSRDGVCIREKKPDGVACAGGVCNNGICVNTAEVRCQERDATINTQITTVTCPIPTTPCVKYTCGDISSSLGGCVESPVEWGPVQNQTTPTPCDDDNLLTVNDVCSNKQCLGVDKCSNTSCAAAPNTCYESGTCIASTGNCELKVKPAGTPCKTVSNSDGTCLGSVCMLSLSCNGIRCPPYDIECSRPLCNPGCSTAPLADGIICSKGSCQRGLCASSDLCKGVVCQNSPCRLRSFCDINTGLCAGTPAPDGTPCDDGDIFTSNDQCSAGVCMGTVTCSGTLCPTPSSPCEYFTCNSTSQCVPKTRYPGTVCSQFTIFMTDSLNVNSKYKQCTASGECQVPDRCANVLCGNPISPCIHEVCEPTTGKCISEHLPDRTSCRINNFEGLCLAGGCSRIQQCNGLDCLASSQCSEAACVDNICVQLPRSDISCDDNIPTTVMDTCTDSQCVGTVDDRCTVTTATNTTITLQCEPVSQCHEQGICIQGQCTTPLKPDGSPCDDNNSTTLSDLCLSGICTSVAKCSSSSVICVPDDPVCGSVYCDENNRCIQSVKQDGTLCNLDQGRCLSGSCVTAVPGDECTVAAQCGTGQYCVDTNLTSTLPSWECRCSQPNQGIMLLGSATCVSPSTPESSSIIVSTRVPVDRTTDFIDAIAKELGISPTKINATASNNNRDFTISFFGSTQGGSQAAENDGLPSSAVMATFQQRVSECVSESVSDFCRNTGISNSLQSDTACDSMVVGSFCTGRSDCFWDGVSCAPRTTAPTPVPSDDSSFPFVAIILIVLGVVICLALLGLWYKKRSKPSSVLLDDQDHMNTDFDGFAAGDTLHEMKEPQGLDPDTLTTPSHRDLPISPVKDPNDGELLPPTFTNEPPPPISYGRGGVLPSFAVSGRSIHTTPLPLTSDARPGRLIDPHAPLHSISNASYTHGTLHTPARHDPDIDNIFTPGFV